MSETDLTKELRDEDVAHVNKMFGYFGGAGDPPDNDTIRAICVAFLDSYLDRRAALDRPTDAEREELAKWMEALDAQHSAQALATSSHQVHNDHMNDAKRARRIAAILRQLAPAQAGESVPHRMLDLGDGNAVCIGGRFDGWLMRRHPDGQFVSVRLLSRAYEPPSILSQIAAAGVQGEEKE